MKVELSDSEWMSLIDGEREDSGLSRCCANVSALRDCVVLLARNGGRVDVFTQQEFGRRLGWVADGHELPADSPLWKLAKEMQVPVPQEHKPQEGEL